MKDQGATDANAEFNHLSTILKYFHAHGNKAKQQQQAQQQQQQQGRLTQGAPAGGMPQTNGEFTLSAD